MMQMTRYPRPTMNVLLITGCTCSALSNDEMLHKIIQSPSYSKMEAHVNTKGQSRGNSFLRT